MLLNRPFRSFDAGSKVTLSWSSADDHGVVAHRLLFNPNGNFSGGYQTIATLPASQKSYEWTVPSLQFVSGYVGSTLRIVAVDTAGQESFDEAWVFIPGGTMAGTLTFNGLAAGQTFRAGELHPIPVTRNGVDPYAVVEGFTEEVNGSTRQLTKLEMPYISSDTVRLVYAIYGPAHLVKYVFSPFFTIRPDPRIGDAPPTISLLSPTSGQRYPAGGVVPISWTASDDEGLRGFDIVVSYDGGQRWQTIAKDLPATATSYAWQTAPGAGYADVRLMVIARDWRFQTTSAGRDAAFALGDAAALPVAASLSVNPTTIPSGGSGSATGTITLSAPAPAGGALVTLSSDNLSLVTTPATVTVPAGALSAAFPVGTTTGVSTATVTLSASYNGGTATAALTLTMPAPTAALSALSVSPSSVTGGAGATGTITLTSAAPAGGFAVAVGSSSPSVATAPTTVTVAAGATSATFAVTTAPVSATTPVTFTASAGGLSRSATLTVAAPASTDTVAIQKVEYTVSKQQLLVQATSTNATAALTVYAGSTSTRVGTLTNVGGGKYQGQFAWPSNPGSVTARSTLGGTATKAVTLK